MKKSSKSFIISVCVFGAAVALSFLCAFLSHGKIPFTAVIAADFIVFLLFLLTVTAFYLVKSLRRTLYSYENVASIGGLLFLSLLLFAAVSNFISQLNSGAFSMAELFDVITTFPWQFSMFAVPVMFAVCILLGISNIVLMYHEGFKPKNFLSIILGAFYIGGTVLIYYLSRFLENRVFTNEASKLFAVFNTYIPLFFVLMMCYFECVLVGCAVMGYVSAKSVPKFDKDYIIILGCSIDRNGWLLPLLKGRANRAIRFAWDQEIATGKKCLYVPSGGQGKNEIMSEGSAIELYLLSHGAESDEVFPEKKSATTYENMIFSKRVIDSLKPDAKVAFATTNFHVFRSGIIAREVGLDAEGVGNPTKWYFWPNGYIREFIALIVMTKNTHISVAVITAAVCTVLGTLAYMLM